MTTRAYVCKQCGTDYELEGLSGILLCLKCREDPAVLRKEVRRIGGRLFDAECANERLHREIDEARSQILNARLQSHSQDSKASELRLRIEDLSADLSVANKRIEEMEYELKCAKGGTRLYEIGEQVLVWQIEIRGSCKQGWAEAQIVEHHGTLQGQPSYMVKALEGPMWLRLHDELKPKE